MAWSSCREQRGLQRPFRGHFHHGDGGNSCGHVRQRIRVSTVIFSDGTNGEQVLAPDQPVCAGAYAMHAAEADNADTVGGKTPADLTPSGAVMMWAGATPPSGWMLCDGTVYNAAANPQYQPLYNVIGNTYGGSNNTKLQSARICGVESLSASTPRDVNMVRADALGETGGEEKHTLSTSEIAPHTHYIEYASNGASGGAGYYSLKNRSDLGTNWIAHALQDQPPDGWATGNGYENGIRAGALINEPQGQPHENMPPFITLNYIMKY